MQAERKRFIILKTAVGLFAVALLCRLFYLQVVKGDEYLAMSTQRFTTSIVDKAPRGEILDRNGKALVSNRVGYSLQIQKTDMSNDDLNDMLLKLLKILEESGTAYYDTLPLSADGHDFVFQDDNMDGSTEDEKSTWFKERKNSLNEGMTADEVFDYYTEKVYKLKNGYTDEEKRKIIGVRYEADLRGGFTLTSPFVLAEDIDINVVTKIKERQREFAGVLITNDYIRNYDKGTLAAHILGRIGKMNAQEYASLKGKGYGYNDIVGKQGIEKIAEEYLHGTDGTKNVEQNVNGNIVKLAEDVDPVPGNYVMLTIDSDLQAVAEESLARNIAKIRESGGSVSDRKGADANAGAVVVLDVKNGNVLAMASYPTYDPANFNKDYQKLSTDKDKPMWNRALGGTYTPGSTFKPLTAIAALETGAINPSEIIECKGVYTFYSGYQPRCWIWTEQHRTHGPLNVSGAIENSCNYFFYEAGRRTGIDKIDEYAAKFGLGEFTGIELSDEVKGNAASPAVKEKAGKTKDEKTWYGGDTLQAAIGQSYNSFTPIQLASYIATIANGGTRYKTNIIQSVRSSVDGSIIKETQPTVLETIKMSSSTIKAVKEGMKRVVEEGSASSIFEGYPIAIGGKTGTAQIGSKVSNNALFVAFAPFDDPEIAVAVVIEHGFRGANSGYVAKDIFDEYFKLNTTVESDRYSINQMLP
ncbi:MAG: penicillin-binding protein 2 [Clostridia bacterium]|nr:penicillin-binding protein 2 [Clostridia bacterium]